LRPVGSIKRNPRAWLWNLANWFPGLADGPVIVARLLLSQKDFGTRRAAAKTQLLDDYRRGIPVYSLAVDWLAQGVMLLVTIRTLLRPLATLAESHSYLIPLVPLPCCVSLSESNLMSFRLTMHPGPGERRANARLGRRSNLRHALIDLGRTTDFKGLLPKLKDIGRFELFTISRIDADHIEGAMTLLKDAPTDVWFNAWHHLKNAEMRLKKVDGSETLSAKQGEKLSAGILRFGWNRAFGADGIVSADSPSGQQTIELAGGLTITLLPPGDQELASLEPVWMKELAKANLRPLDPDEAPYEAPVGLKAFIEEKVEPNGASIAFLAEFGGRRADAILAVSSGPSKSSASATQIG
jgi:hypothetical protein